MKNTVLKFRLSVFAYIFSVLMISTGCDGMITELDIDVASFPPKLCVTAILDGASGTFSIVLTEGRALADYKTPRPDGQKVIANGEIRLFEDDLLILSKSGEFDMTTTSQQSYVDPDTWEWIYPEKGGYRFETSVATHPGSVYRLEVEADGYKTVTSTSVMPDLPDVSATVNTSEIFQKELMHIKEFSSLEGWYGGRGGNFSFWPVTLQWGKRNSGRNYYALEMHEESTLLKGTPFTKYREGKTNIGIYVTDLTKLQDNPEVEIFEAELGMDVSSNICDMYRFPILLMSDIGFAKDHASLNLYKEKPYNLMVDDSMELLPQYPAESYDVSIYRDTITLRVRNITEATFRYYRSLAMQSIGMDFFTEPVNILGNIKNGYGGFTVFSAVDIQLMEYETYIFQKAY